MRDVNYIKLHWPKLLVLIPILATINYIGDFVIKPKVAIPKAYTCEQATVISIQALNASMRNFERNGSQDQRILSAKVDAAQEQENKLCNQ